MKEKRILQLATLVPALLGAAVLLWWMFFNPVHDLTLLEPGKDNRPEGMASGDLGVRIGEFFQPFAGVPSVIKASWPRFRGKDFDNISKETIPLAEGWGDEAPPRLWSVELGEGHSGPVVSDGKVFLLDYDEKERRDILRCFSLEDGQEIWQRGYDVYVKRNHGMSRTTPAVAHNSIVTMGPKCHVMCVDADSGAFKWGVDVVAEYGTEVPLWYTGQCPLIDDTTAVIATGGKALLVGYDLHTGDILWQTPNPEEWQMSHSSVIPMTLHGTRMYVYMALGGMAGVSAEPENLGEILFQTSEWQPNVIAPAPVHVGDGRIYVTAGYAAGSMTFQVSKNQNQFSIETISVLKPEEGLASEQQTPILWKGHLFGILPKDAGPNRNQFVCCKVPDFSTFKWTSGKTNRFGLGPYLIADGKFFILSDDGVLTILKLSDSKYLPLSQTKILDGHDAWGPMALVEGRLLARDSRQLVCLDIRK